MNDILINRNVKKENQVNADTRIVPAKRESCFEGVYQENHDHMIQDINILNVVLIR